MHASTLQIILPVGISFYTFQTLSYSIDIYRGNLKATRDPVAFAAFVSFFPQLVAGPIERATNLLPQITSPRNFTYEQGRDGMRLILWGMFKKVVVADSCAPYVDMCFDNPEAFSGPPSSSAPSSSPSRSTGTSPGTPTSPSAPPSSSASS